MMMDYNSGCIDLRVCKVLYNQVARGNCRRYSRVEEWRGTREGDASFRHATLSYGLFILGTVLSTRTLFTLWCQGLE